MNSKGSIRVTEIADQIPVRCRSWLMLNPKISAPALLLISVLLFFGCESPVEQPAVSNALSVVGVLHTDKSDDQMIQVFNTSSFGDKDLRDNFITNAKVYVTDSMSYNSRYYFTSNADQMKYYKDPDKAEFVPGRKYYLRVETPSGIVQGETQFPEDFEITSHKDNDTLYIPENVPQDIEIRWSKTNASYGYLIDVVTSRKIEDSNGQEMPDYTGGSYNIYSSEDNHCSVPVYKGYAYGKVISEEVKITVTAYDKNYRAHHYESSNSAGLKGAYGCFASTVSKSVKLIVK